MAKTKATKPEKRVRISTRRSANFTNHEKQVLLSLMQEYREIVEDRHTDGVTVREKNTAWITLTNKYNAENGVSSRSVKQLRQCWKNLKSRSRVEFVRVPGEPGSNESSTITLVQTNPTAPSSLNAGSAVSGNTLTLVAVSGISNSVNPNNQSSESSNNTSSINNASTIILNNILTNNRSNIIHDDDSSNRNTIRPTNGIASGDLSPESGSPGLSNFNQSLPSVGASSVNRQRSESKTTSSNKKRKKKTPNNSKSIGSVTPASTDDDSDAGGTEVNPPRRKSRHTLLHLDYNENGVADRGNVTEVERPRRKTRPSVMHLDYDVSTNVDDEDEDEDDDDEEEEEGAIVADEQVGDQIQVTVGYPHDSAVVVNQQGHSHESEEVYPTNTLAVVSVSGSADRIHFNNHASSPDTDTIHHHHHQSQAQNDYRLNQHHTSSHLQIQPSSYQPSQSNPLEVALNNTTNSDHDIKVFDSIRGFGKVLHTPNALPTHLVNHISDGRSVHSVNLGPSINYSDEVNLVNNVPSSHTAPQIVSAHVTNGPSQIPSIEPVLLEKVTNTNEHNPAAMDFSKTEHSEKMKNIRLERKLIAIEHKARMELIKLKSEYVKMKMQVLLNDRS